MIDKHGRRFLDFCSFVVRNGPSSPPCRLALAAALLFLGGCSARQESAPVEDTITSGRIKVVCATEAYGVVDRARAAFDSLYPQARIELEPGTSRDAVSALFGARAEMAVLTRELEQEEREAAVRGRLELEGYRFARDAVRIVVHPDNPVENLGVDDLRGMLRGSIRSWFGLGGRDIQVVAVIQSLESDLTSHWLTEVMGSEPVAVPTVQAESDAGVVEQVRRDPRTVGYVSMAARVEGVKVVRMAALRGLPYWKPDPEAIHRGEYPLTRYFNLYVRPGESRLAAGFVTFMTNIDGQRLVRDAGLVPTAVPVRFVRRSPLRGAH